MGILLDDEGEDEVQDSNDDRVKTSGDVSVALVLSRDVCKLKFIVGCAPVLYGVPKLLSPQTSQKDFPTGAVITSS